ncbi:hypothetical protein Tco_0436032 [Tanacetum coccineum]
MPTPAPTSFPPLLLPSDRPELTFLLDGLVSHESRGAPLVPIQDWGTHEEFESYVRRDTERSTLRCGVSQRTEQLLAGRVNMLFRDRRGHAHTRQLMETEAGMSREAWGRR